jgi:TRAP-type C4-dicarboxylate transport system substrate-binding protein
MREPVMLVRLAAIAALLAFARPACAQVTLDLINEYPATAISGEADAFFADAVKRKSDGRIVIRPIPDAKSGFRSRDQLKAVTDGRFAMANTVGGTLGEEDPVFLLSSLPFVTPGVADARALYDMAKPLYEQLFAARKQKLLYVVPWPPSGIWSAAPVSDIAALKALKIRTYDNTGTAVMAKVAASAAIVTFSELNAKLEKGEINAVLSSGDGGAGRQMWKYLKNFSDVGYALPVSLASISLSTWTSLDDAGRAAIEEAANETSEHQWAALAGRLAENFARMRQNGVVIDETPPADVMAAAACRGRRNGRGLAIARRAGRQKDSRRLSRRARPTTLVARRTGIAAAGAADHHLGAVRDRRQRPGPAYLSPGGPGRAVDAIRNDVHRVTSATQAGENVVPLAVRLRVHQRLAGGGVLHNDLLLDAQQVFDVLRRVGVGLEGRRAADVRLVGRICIDGAIGAEVAGIG